MLRKIAQNSGVLFSLALICAAIVIVERGTSAQASRVPNFEFDPLFFHNLPNRWTTGQVGGISVDDQDHVWILQRPASIAEGERSAALTPPAALCCVPAPPVLEFDQSGRFVKAWGGPGQGIRMAHDRARHHSRLPQQRLGGRQRQRRSHRAEVLERR